MRGAADRTSALNRLKRGIDSMPGPQVVFVDHKGRFDHFTAHGPRHAAMVASPTWAGQIKGVFTPGVSVGELGMALYHDD